MITLCYGEKKLRTSLRKTLTRVFSRCSRIEKFSVKHITEIYAVSEEMGSAIIDQFEILNFPHDELDKDSIIEFLRTHSIQMLQVHCTNITWDFENPREFREVLVITTHSVCCCYLFLFRSSKVHCTFVIRSIYGKNNCETLFQEGYKYAKYMGIKDGKSYENCQHLSILRSWRENFSDYH